MLCKWLKSVSEFSLDCFIFFGSLWTTPSSHGVKTIISLVYLNSTIPNQQDLFSRVVFAQHCASKVIAYDPPRCGYVASNTNWNTKSIPTSPIVLYISKREQSTICIYVESFEFDCGVIINYFFSIRLLRRFVMHSVNPTGWFEFS